MRLLGARSHCEIEVFIHPFPVLWILMESQWNPRNYRKIGTKTINAEFEQHLGANRDYQWALKLWGGPGGLRTRLFMFDCKSCVHVKNTESPDLRNILRPTALGACLNLLPMCHHGSVWLVACGDYNDVVQECVTWFASRHTTVTQRVPFLVRIWRHSHNVSLKFRWGSRVIFVMYLGISR